MTKPGDTSPTAKSDVRAFWTALYKSAYTDVDKSLDGTTLLRLLDDTEAMFRYREHLATTEMPLNGLNGKRVLEVGCGAGSHSALFARHGAHMTALDLSHDRAAATSNKFSLLGKAAVECAALQGDAEKLPFADNTFDIVYSNGVLHHSPDTSAAVLEVRRVLKPGGLAVVMLYCKSSVNWWVTLWLGYGVLRGQLRAGHDRLGAKTEWAGNQSQTTENPITRAYMARDVRNLFGRFEQVHLRKSEFAIVQLPKIGKLWRSWLTRRGRLHAGGLLPYGAPWPITSPAEIWLGRYVGWAWNIRATKATAAKD